MKISAAYAYLNETIALSRHETKQLINRHAQYFLICDQTYEAFYKCPGWISREQI